MNTNTQKVLHDLSVRMSTFPLVMPAPFLLVRTCSGRCTCADNKRECDCGMPGLDDDTRNLLAREAGKQKAKRYTGQPITLWGELT